MSTEIDISKLDKAAALAALYNASRPQGMGFMHYTPDDMTHDEAAALLAARGARLYFDYLKGRVMKLDFTGPTMRIDLYDRDNGQGAAMRALEPLMAK